MKRRLIVLTASPILVALLLASGADRWVAGAATPSRPSLVSQELRDRIQRDGAARVIVELRTPAGVHMPEGSFSAPAAVARQRLDILAARSSVLTRLRPTLHRVLHQYASVPFVALAVGPDALSELEAASFQVARIVEDQISFLQLPVSAPLVQAPQAWARGYDGTGTVIAVLDTGISPRHLFLRDKLVDEGCFSSGPYGLCPGGAPQEVGPGTGVACALPLCEHGSMVAGIALGDGSGAAVSFSGIARGARLASFQVFSGFDCDGVAPCLGAFDSDIMAALEQVLSLRTTHNFAAVNLSLGAGRFTAPCDNDVLKPAIDNLRSVGIPAVIAAGNNAYSDALSRPACISSAVSVGSTFRNGNFDSLFTNTAPFMSFFAPGVSILTALLPHFYGQNSGTSLAAPHVSGAWAVLRQAVPTASVNDIFTALEATGVPVTDTRPGGTVTRPRIRVAEALNRLLGIAAPVPTLATLTPSSTTTGGPAFTLTADGTNFAPGATLFWNGAARPTTFVSATRVTTSIPAADIGAPGSASVTVRNPDAQLTNALTFTIDPLSGGPCPTGQFFVEYFSNGSLAGSATRTECETLPEDYNPGFRRDWGTGAPPGLPVDNFSVRWTGRFRFADSSYVFRAAAFDGAIRIYVDGVLILDATQSRVTYWSTRPLTAGEHEVRIEYFERGGSAIVNADWAFGDGPTPLVDTVTPSSVTAGGPAFTLTADGRNFVPGTQLYWNGMARPTTFVSANRVTASIPSSDIATVGTGWILLRNPDFQDSNSRVVTIVSDSTPAPTLTALTPSSAMAGGPGFTLTVDGTGFVSGVTVLWNSTARSTTFVSATRVTASIPASDIAFPGSASVSVRNPSGLVSNTRTFLITGSPTITTLTPSSATAGGPAFTLTVNGSGFVSGATVLWNGVSRTTTFVSASQITAAIPASDIASAGSATVTATNPGTATSNALSFTINPGASFTASITYPAPGATVSGTKSVGLSTTAPWGQPKTWRLLVDNAVEILNVTTPTGSSYWTSWDTTRVANGLRTLTLRVTDGTGATATASIQVRVANSTAPPPPAPPTLISLSPSSATAGGPAFTLTVNGSGFVSGATVFWNGASRTTTFVSATQVTAAVPASDIGSAGNATVTATNPGTAASNGLSFTINSAGPPPPAPPTLTSLSPSSATAGGPSFTLTVNGSGFVSGATVLWNGASRTTTFVSPSQVAAAIPASDIASAGSATVTATNPGTAASNGLAFTINPGASFTASITYPAPGATVSGTKSVGLSTTAPWGQPKTWRLLVDDTLEVLNVTTPTGSSYWTSWDTTRVADGLRTLTLRVTDATGATASASIQVRVANGGAPPPPPPPAAPSLISLSPSSATAGGPAFTLTVNGSGFVSGATVLWNGASRTTTFVSASQVTAAIPASDIAAAGNATVTATNPGTAASNGLTFTINSGGTADFTASITYPAAGATVSGTQSVGLSTTAPWGQSKTWTLSVNGTVITSQTNTGTTLWVQWNTTASQNGDRTLRLDVTMNGQTATATRPVRVSN